jgi:hypothetical protein
MTDNNIREQADGYFGWCPQCRNNNGYRNIGRDHWFVCDEHKTKWCVGANLFSSWKEQTEEDWQKTADLLNTYTEIKPVYDEETAAKIDEQKMCWDLGGGNYGHGLLSVLETILESAAPEQRQELARLAGEYIASWPDDIQLPFVQVLSVMAAGQVADRGEAA